METGFIATISNHRIFGNLILPYAVSHKDDQQFFTVINRLTLNDLKSHNYNLPQGFEELIKLADKYDENEIVKVFSNKV